METVQERIDQEPKRVLQVTYLKIKDGWSSDHEKIRLDLEKEAAASPIGPDNFRRDRVDELKTLLENEDVFLSAVYEGFNERLP
ncbi:MAG: hypothetical protein L6R37_007576 [Teloschistes peruensis]|nr:MAG: hypothetical protein L6R37_007576 [Teloschistes peruensis]